MTKTAIKNCMFQYATRHQILANTDLITKDEALGLFTKNRDDFINRLKNKEEPEMAIWINCNDSSNYGETMRHWHSDDIKVIDGDLYSKI